MKTVLSIAGTDPTGGAGIQTDLKTFEAFGVYGMAVITVVCAQNTTGVFGMQPVSAELVGKQIDCVFDDIFPDAVKVGMLYDAEIIHTVAERLKAYHAKNIVLDPVMMSSSGTALLHHDAAKVLQEELFPLCTLVTPNLHEAAAVCSHNITSREDMEQAAREIVGKTGGAVEVLAVNTLGVLYIVENGETVQSMADLKGQTIVAAGKGSTPEYALRYLLTENGIDPDKDVTIDWKSEHSECVAALASGQAAIALLPQPFVTVAQTKIEGLRMALDLTAEWDKLDNGSALITGVIVARRDVVEANPGAVDSFLQNYAASVEWVNGNTAEAAALVGEYGIVDAAVAEKALPYCNIVCLTGGEMKDKLSGYLQVLADAEPSSVGGALPGDDFYYGA